MRTQSSTTGHIPATVSLSRFALVAATVFGFSVAASPNALGATHHKATRHEAAHTGSNHRIASHTTTHRHNVAERSETRIAGLYETHQTGVTHQTYVTRTVIRHGRVEHIRVANELVGPAYTSRLRNHYRLAVAHYRHSYLQCVPYAREVSHIELSGNAFLWWAEAAGRYARGATPQEGAVLNFRAIGRMPLGHVAVVTSVIDSRTILVTQANWVPGTITNDVTMEDVSANNDWSAVQVELGDSSKWGAAYPTYGFIYNQPETVIAGAAPATEVAEAPAARSIAQSAPNRSLQ
jgi:surface antigen